MFPPPERRGSLMRIVPPPVDASRYTGDCGGLEAPGKGGVISQRRPTSIVAAAVTILVLALVVANVVMTRRIMDRRFGFVVESESRPLQVVEVEPGSPAEAGGLKPDDRNIALDGTPIQDEAGYDALARGFRPHEPVRFTVRRGDRTVELELRPGMRWIGWKDVLGILTILAYLGLGLAALTYAGMDERATLLFSFSAAVALELAIPGNLVGIRWEAFYSILAIYLLNGFQFGIEIHLASVIPRPHPYLQRHPWLPPFFYLSGVLLAMVPISAVVAAGRGVKDFPISVTAAGHFFDDGVFLVWAAAVTAILAGGVRLARTSRERSQALLVLLGVLPWTVHVFATTVWGWVGGQTPQWLLDLSPLILLVYPIAVFVAIFRYRLFEIEVVVRKGLVYGTLTGLMLLIFYAAIGLGGALVSRLLGDVSSVWVFSAATLIIGLLASPLHRWVQHAIERKVFPERHRLRQRLVQLASDLPARGQLPAMGRHLVTELRKSFGAEQVALLLADPSSGVLAELASSGVGSIDGGASLLLAPDDPGIEALRKAGRPLPAGQLMKLSGSLAQRFSTYNARLAVPLLSGERLVGLLLFGPLEEGESYGSEELELLTLLSRNAATVFENVRLFQSATYEGLTGLLRREAILERLDLELERALRYGRPLAVGMADLDHFKDVNDGHGHLAGDALLKRVAEEISRCLRTTDAVGRYGGEEFLLVLPETTLDGARAVAEKVRAAIAALEVPVGNDTTVRVTLSIGLATFDPDNPAGLTALELIAQADAQLLEAKRQGRNRVLP